MGFYIYLSIVLTSGRLEADYVKRYNGVVLLYKPQRHVHQGLTFTIWHALLKAYSAARIMQNSENYMLHEQTGSKTGRAR